MESTRSITRVPTRLGPVGLGAAALRVAARADGTAEARSVHLPEHPDKGTSCGLAPPSSLTETEPLNVPVDDGLNVTLIVQDNPAPTLDLQVFVWGNGGLGVEVMLVMLSVVLPMLVSVVVLVLE